MYMLEYYTDIKIVLSISLNAVLHLIKLDKQAVRTMYILFGSTYIKYKAGKSLPLKIRIMGTTPDSDKKGA